MNHPPPLQRILPGVLGPGQYVGGEPNAIVKPAAEVELRFALAFADTYSVGMSHHGSRILYEIANRLPGVACERVFAPLPDMEAALRQAGLRLGTLETWTPLSECDLVGVSVPGELAATSLLTILDLGGLPILASERSAEHPLVIAGGCVFNPEPLADFIDGFLVGDGEDALVEILEILREARRLHADRQALLARLAGEVKGFYAPGLYATAANALGFLAVRPGGSGTPPPIRRRVHEFAATSNPVRPIVPVHQTAHERVTLEIMRGCPNGCRFCQAGYVYRPVRWRSVEALTKQAEAAAAATGFDEIGLLSLSTSDYPHFDELVARLDQAFAPQHISLSLPSLRVDSGLLSIPSRFRTVRKSGLTLAPEAATDRLRAVINKDVKTDDLIAAATEAFAQGWQTIKLYFMIGLPTETQDDVLAIARLANQVAGLRRKRGKKPAVTLSVSSFVPKPHTPFQWQAMDSREALAAKQAMIGRAVDRRRVQYRTHDIPTSLLEGALARGDRSLGRVIIAAWKKGARLDAWTDHFRPGLWAEAFAEAGIDPDRYACQPRPPGEPLPWSHIDCGVSEALLLRERERALAGERTPACGPEACAGCGIGDACRMNRGTPSEP